MEEQKHFISRAQAEEMFAAYDRLDQEQRLKLLAQLPEGFTFPLHDVVKLTQKGVAAQFMVRLGLKNVQGKGPQEVTPVLYLADEKGNQYKEGAKSDGEEEDFLDEGQRWP